MIFTIEHTDTFAGEANYSWVTRKEIELPDNSSRRQIVRKAKKELGLTGVRCRVEEFGWDIIIRPVGICQIVFVSSY